MSITKTEKKYAILFLITLKLNVTLKAFWGSLNWERENSMTRIALGNKTIDWGLLRTSLGPNKFKQTC
jgi:hypothetical protein